MRLVLSLGWDFGTGGRSVAIVEFECLVMLDVMVVILVSLSEIFLNE